MEPEEQKCAEAAEMAVISHNAI